MVPARRWLLLFPLLAASGAPPEPWGKLVRIGGHEVHLRCEGKGAVTVLLLHGTPRFSFHFASVMPQVARVARVCAYDRAGDAWSAPVPGQPTAAIFLEELDRVARYLSPARPVVLAGHSVGGVFARAYFAARPERVSAMVLIDTVPLDMGQLQVSTGPVSMVDATDEQIREAADAARKRPRPAAPKSTVSPPFDRLPASLHTAHTWATDQWQEYAAGVDLYVALKYQADLYKAAAKARVQDPVPVWFLARAKTADGPDAWVDAQRKMAAAWARGKLLRTAPSGHDIQLEQPDAVAAAIIEAVRAAAPAR